MTFSDFNLSSEIIEGINCMGFKAPTPIQEQAIPLILSGKDLIGCAQTGTGKTGAFLLPVMSNIIKGKRGKVKALVIVPTRELASQIDQQATALSYFSDISTYPVYGGGSGSAFDQEKQAFVSGTDIIIATPGRLIMHLNQKYVDFSELQYLILDEADRMLDMGFFEDIMKVVGHIPPGRQTLLFSATMPPKIKKLATSILRDPEEISIAVSRPAEKILQNAFSVYEEQKPGLVKHIISERKPESTIVFTSSRLKVKEILRELKQIGVRAKGISSDLEQAERESVLIEFRNRQLPVIVATDVLARGIDIEGIELVLNYDVPGDAEDYIHRIGRTARAQATGVAITFISPQDQYKFKRIEKLIGSEIIKPELPEFLGTAPALGAAADNPNKKKRKSNTARKTGNTSRENTNSGQGQVPAVPAEASADSGNEQPKNPRPKRRFFKKKKDGNS